MHPHVRHYIVPSLGKVRLDRLKVADVQIWLNELPARCQCCAQGKDARRLERGTARCCVLGQCCRSFPSPRTVKDVRAVLRSPLSSAMRQELVERNVAELVTTPQQRKRKVVPVDQRGGAVSLSLPRSDADSMYAAFVLVVVLGLRKGEVLGLRWDAIDLAASELVVDHKLQRVNRSLLYRATKTEASDASLPMPGIVATALQLRRIDQDRSRTAAGEAWRQTEREPRWCLPVATGHRVDPRTLNDRFTRRCHLSGVRPLTVHDARRTCATSLVDLDVHQRVIMRVLRHSDQAVTMQIYAQASSEATREALSRLGETLR
jgi:integrase